LNHPVRIVNTILDGIDVSSLEATYKGGGTSSYHPKVLLKILVYAYLRNLYSSRKIEQALSENIHFMWLSGCIKPDHNTIANFRSGKLKGKFKKIFNQVVVLLASQGYLNLKDIYVDGTKIEANANRYTFVWGKNIKTSRER
ncbi:transposase, partial [Aquimarina celericrescens]|nr:transposase [Aquimarina celericrescens]